MIQNKKAVFKERSLEENAYYWGCVIEKINKFKHWQSEKSHEWVKDTFNINSTADLTTFEFEILMTSVRGLCLEFWSLEIPKPNE